MDNRYAAPRIARSHRVRLSFAAVAASVVLVAPMIAAGASSATIKVGNVPSFSGALVNHSSRTLYILSAEKGGKIKCKASCTPTWIPLTVKSSATVKSVSVGAGVKGKIGFVTRSATKKQVTFNSYPVYTYQGDTGALQSNGSEIHADGGTWTLIKAGATSASATPYAASTGGGGGY
jgi:predicted lipoprotein with Yx(FWY)xxD motif